MQIQICRNIQNVLHVLGRGWLKVFNNLYVLGSGHIPQQTLAVTWAGSLRTSCCPMQNPESGGPWQARTAGGNSGNGCLLKNTGSISTFNHQPGYHCMLHTCLVGVALCTPKSMTESIVFPSTALSQLWADPGLTTLLSFPSHPGLGELGSQAKQKADKNKFSRAVLQGKQKALSFWDLGPPADPRDKAR